MSNLHVVLAGGGTAGHVNPLLATARALHDDGATVTAVGTTEGLENDLVPAAGVPLRTIERAPFPRRPNLAAIQFPHRFHRAVKEAGAILDAERADVAVGFGGFASTPVYVAAKKRGIPVVIHEQNAKPGMANKYGARFAAVVALTFASTPLAARDGATELTGLPLRPEIAALARARQQDPRAGRAEAAVRLGVDPDFVTLVVTGGSLGAQHLNDVMTQSLPLFEGIQVVHLTGKGKDERVRAASAEVPHYRVFDYLQTMEDAYAVADLVLCRAGAGTVAELGALGIPAFFVPLPIGNGEQELNAADVVAAGGAYVVRDADFTAPVMAARVIPLLADPAKRAAMSHAARGTSPIDGAARLAALIEAAGTGRL
ncbi:MAG: undecaprenyldiphospho-muramoylpentapeptide beta-N-acetylglucosaminyltransferase [Ancrocorticia sp.]|jgi:UDP-N-acetylglucosamine--N-acetylmuramyl-(pentapeptide) pyrophosphoryl-undecaprenol N-acetylglucosamine transferase|nr:undecaprenyldiphospho-muramoylpentapeptide beta-N-acetylglucosaminyltransferase [Ancrocorticia sp.]MCI1895330.1 undecaprenyldiphospho-muramoylpentapeptide beta-N-acetylglucosaminyltransferase [Ancrocorticia sp.]MCI1932063.1 undecaprenyldiphospho-muramoylpentapeptide beta-N-acetylglucosaminyltransferase [Ancrocorticia sp.]MCI1963424.1 undecaprenyldiphospho-muramoylpentapeptide beta-N-acetylglucosaminyltransferase [Ancrocorticia sp.]MCI2002382.1 undecaprenyldiphospho-muramoylpentapeptide beta-